VHAPSTTWALGPPTPPRTGLADCAAEPIRTPGSIQPHGQLLALDANTLEVAVFSANGSLPAASALAARLDRERLAPLVDGAPPVSLGVVALDDGALDVSAHRAGAHFIVESEPCAAPLGTEAPIYSLTRQFLPRLQEATSLEALAQLAADEMKRLTGFGRCLVYRFDASDDGEVLAEAIEPGYDSYAGHHFPAADIPPQARALYLLNHFRLIGDANYTPVPLLATTPGLAAEAIDLSQAQLRSVSPIHLEYMRNMGTLASMSVSIVVKGRLWGLISCHDHAPRHLQMPVRLACEHLGQLLALQIQSSESARLTAAQSELRQLTLAIVAHLSDSDATLQALVDEPALLLRLMRAHGAAVVLDDEVWTTGEVPDTPHILELSAWIDGLGQPLYHSDALATHCAAAAGFRDAAGVLAVSISQVHRHQILWFRPERVATVTWAGDPRKAGQALDGRIHPRASFHSWVEEVRGHSRAWSGAELGAAAELRQALIAIVLRRAEEMAAIASELGRVNKELEAFSYTVSHDLRAPMRHIAGYVDLVLDDESNRLGERAVRHLSQVKEAASYAGQLVDALLDFSRLSRSALKTRDVDTQLLVGDLVREILRHEPPGQVEWTIAPDLPTLHADPLLLQVALRNLLSNAVKYARSRRPARITVRRAETALGQGVEIEDNGVGFQMKYVGKLFGVFQRLHHAEEFEGTGIGLANVRRIVERHGGEVWAHGEAGLGARFGFVLPAASAATAPVLSKVIPHAQAHPAG